MISLPLAKLSTAQDTAVDATKFDWSHETQNLTVVIDSFGARGTSGQLLKVVQGTRVLVRATSCPALTTLKLPSLFTRADMCSLALDRDRATH
jgi:hypothetical protein